MINCRTCDQPIPEARLRAKPDVIQCVPCVEAAGDEPGIKGRMIWTGKQAPEIEIGTRLAAASNKRQGYGPGIRFDSGEAIKRHEIGVERDGREEQEFQQRKQDHGLKIPRSFVCDAAWSTPRPK